MKMFRLNEKFEKRLHCITGGFTGIITVLVKEQVGWVIAMCYCVVAYVIIYVMLRWILSALLNDKE